jgi:hypothetical protein
VTTLPERQASCPICSGSGRLLLQLQRQPIYQHPVAIDVVVPQPHAVDLTWVSCEDCGHAWQPDFDSELLENIYRSYYYTPAPDGIAVQFRDDYLAVLDKLGLAGRRRVLLEIGASSGDVLAALVQRTGAVRAYAFEPNAETAAVARKRGLDVRETFFSANALGEDLEPADLLYARHVIEHVFDFEDFFSALSSVSVANADLVLETPSLDFHVRNGSIDPFHVEHVHVFALRSLARLASRFGWGLQNAEVTTAGNLIASFRKGAAGMQVPAPDGTGLQSQVSLRADRLRQIFANRSLIFWGAGSSGVNLASVLGREPDIWTDGNPAKEGKRFVGLVQRIVSPEHAIAAARERPESEHVVVITSAFASEILPRVRALGWEGEVRDTSGNRL